MNVRSPLAVLLASVSVVSACSSSSGGTTAAPPAAIPLDQVPPMLAQAECDLLNRCFGAVASIVIGTNDCVTHETKSISAGSFASYPGLISSGKLTYDGTQVQACLDALRAQDCAAANALPTVCKSVLTGKTAVGDACTENDECAGDGACVGKGGMCPGTCTARVPSDGMCTRNEECIDGLVCSGAKCVTPAGVGQACNGGAPPCGGQIVCVGANTQNMTPGTCKAASDAFTATVGMPCDPSTTALCAAGAFCALTGITGNTQTFQCIGQSSNGGACKVALPESCPSGQYCSADLQTGKVDGTCVNAIEDGQPCKPSYGGTGCKTGSVCELMTGGPPPMGVCRPIQDNGGSCSTSATCYSGNCTGGTCQAGTACSKP